MGEIDPAPTVGRRWRALDEYQSGAGKLNEMGMGYSVLDWVCIGTAVLASVPPIIGAVTNLWRGQLGAADRRPEPTIAALLANASWLLFGLTENLVEPLRLNLVGGGAQVTALVAFLVLTDHQRAQILIIPVTLAGFYYVAVLGVGLSHLQLVVYQSLCAFAGMLASAAPLLTFRFLLEGPIVEFLPPWWLLLFYTVHGLVWCVRALRMHPQNLYMLSQNVILVACSVSQLFIALQALHPNLPIDQDPHGLLQGLLPQQPAQDQLQAGQDQLPHVQEQLQAGQDQLPHVQEQPQAGQDQLPQVEEMMHPAQEQLPAADDAQQPDNDVDPHGDDHAGHDAHNDDDANDDEPNDEDADGDDNPNDEDVHDDAEDDGANGDNQGEDVHDDAEDDDANGDNQGEEVHDDAEDDDANGNEVHDDAEDDGANGDNHAEDHDAHSDDDAEDDDDHGDDPAHGDEPNNDDEQPAGVDANNLPIPGVDANNLLIAGGDDQNLPIPGGDENILPIPLRRSRRIAAIAAARARAAAAAADH